MGGAGKALPGAGKRRKSNSPRLTAAQGAGPIPHPVRLASGQRFAPLRHRPRRPFTITSVAPDGTVRAVKEDGAKERIRLRAERLLARDERADGINYRFIGYRPGRRYHTYACIAAVEGQTAVLVLPDWHPARTVGFPRRLLPVEVPGGWLEVTADLGQARAGALNLADIRPCPAPSHYICHRPDPAALPDLAPETAVPKPAAPDVTR